jgi:hypothetical protein
MSKTWRASRLAVAGVIALLFIGRLAVAGVIALLFIGRLAVAGVIVLLELIPPRP